MNLSGIKDRAGLESFLQSINFKRLLPGGNSDNRTSRLNVTDYVLPPENTILGASALQSDLFDLRNAVLGNLNLLSSRDHVINYPDPLATSPPLRNTPEEETEIQRVNNISLQLLESMRGMFHEKTLANGGRRRKSRRGRKARKAKTAKRRARR
jgi:hypothetical protein